MKKTNVEGHELFPCPRCGSVDLRISEILDGEGVYVVCNGCRWVSRTEYNWEDSLEVNWNSKTVWMTPPSDQFTREIFE